MRYLIGLLVALALVASPRSVSAQAGEEAQASAGRASHAKHHLPPQLMLRVSYFYLPEHLEQRRPGHQEKVTPTAAEQTQEKNQRSPGAKAEIAVGVIVGVGLIGFGIGASVVLSNWDF